MEIIEHFRNSENSLDRAKAEWDKEDYHCAIQSLATVYAHIRELLQHAYELDREKAKIPGPSKG